MNKRYTIKQLKKEKFNKLLKEGKFYTISEIYGSHTYNAFLPEMFKSDVINEVGKTEFKKIKNIKICKEFFLIVTAGIVLSQDIGGVNCAIEYEKKIKENSQIYATEIRTYDEKIDKYAEEINSLGLNNFQIIMKEQYDLWTSIEGYDTAELNVIGFYRLAFLEDGKTGVCRHMADDTAAKLNAINPEFNARTLIVYRDNCENYSKANIERKINENYNSPSETSEVDLMLRGNHMVVLADIKEDNITLVIDPTNCSLGVFKNGTIHMFSTPDGSGYYLPIYGQCLQGISGKIDYVNSAINSFSNADIEELRNKYGIEAENKVLEDLKEKNLIKTK